VDEFAHKISLREVLADATAVKFPVDAVEQLISPLVFGDQMCSQSLVIIQAAEAWGSSCDHGEWIETVRRFEIIRGLSLRYDQVT